MFAPPGPSLSTVWERAVTVTYDRCTWVSGQQKDHSLEVALNDTLLGVPTKPDYPGATGELSEPFPSLLLSISHRPDQGLWGGQSLAVRARPRVGPCPRTALRGQACSLGLSTKEDHENSARDGESSHHCTENTDEPVRAFALAGESHADLIYPAGEQRHERPKQPESEKHGGPNGDLFQLAVHGHNHD